MSETKQVISRFFAAFSGVRRGQGLWGVNLMSRGVPRSWRVRYYFISFCKRVTVYYAITPYVRILTSKIIIKLSFNTVLLRKEPSTVFVGFFA